MVQQDLCVTKGKSEGIVLWSQTISFGKRHNSDMLADFGFVNQHQQHSFVTGGRPLCIYGDPAYPLRVHSQIGFRGANKTREEELWNSKMCSVKQAVEWIFTVNFSKLLDFKKNLRIRLSPFGKCT